jgi:para-aminobenzoate synthetase/4-amino-4-deoxychorismate lyase
MSRQPVPGDVAARAGMRVASDTRTARSDQGTRPDPARGVFETLLVRDGSAIRAEAHLARLRRSVATLYDAHLPGDLGERTRTAAREARDARLRITAVPASPDPVEVSMEVRPLTPRALPIELQPVRSPGGLGAHKWCDRTWLASVDAGGYAPLLVDTDGCVLEAAWGNVFAVLDDLICTPAIDGRLLPGVTRAALLSALAAAGEPVVEGSLTLLDAAKADLLFVTSSLASVAPAILSPGQAADAERALALTQLLEAVPPSRAKTASLHTVPRKPLLQP